MGLPKKVTALRATRTAELCARIENLVTDSGKTLVPTEEAKRRPKEKYTAYFDRLKRTTSSNPSSAALVKCTGDLVNAFDTYGDWLHCGAIFACMGHVHRLDMTRPEAEVASMRVFLARSVEELRTCSVCLDLDSDVACPSCWTCLCRNCVAACALHSSDYSVHTCPNCKAASPIEDVVGAIEAETRATGHRPFQAVRETMRAMGVKRTEVTLQTVLPVDESDTDSSSDGWSESGGESPVDVYRCGFDVRIRRNGFVVVEGRRSRFIEKLLHQPGTEILVGEIPRKCACCDEITGSEIEGRSFVVGADGLVRERVGMWACMAAYVRSWGAHGASESSVDELD